MVLVVPPVVAPVLEPVCPEVDGIVEEPELEVDPVCADPVVDDDDAELGSAVVVLPEVEAPVGFVIVPLFCWSFIPPPVVPVVLPVV